MGDYCSSFLASCGVAVSKTQAAASLMTMSDSVQRAGESINPIIDGEPRDHGRTMTSDEELDNLAHIAVKTRLA